MGDLNFAGGLAQGLGRGVQTQMADQMGTQAKGGLGSGMGSRTGTALPSWLLEISKRQNGSSSASQPTPSTAPNIGFGSIASGGATK